MYPRQMAEILQHPSIEVMAMQYRKLSSTGDYTFGWNSQDYLKQDEAVGQAIKTKILLFYNEWWEDLGQGIPMFQSIMGQTKFEGLKESVSLLVKDRVMEVPNVSSVEDVTVEQLGSRTIKITIRALTDFDSEVYAEVEI